MRVVNGAVQRGMAADGHILAAATRCTELEEWNPAAHNALGLAQEARGLHGAALASYAKAMALLSDAEGRHLAVRFRVSGHEARHDECRPG